MGILEFKKMFLAALCGLFSLSLVFCGVADFGAQSTILIINSQSYEDIISASVYSAQEGYTYTFVLTDAHGKYWEDLISKSSNPILYYESSLPVNPGMGIRLEALSKSGIKVTYSNTLAQDFANMAPSGAILVGRSIGPEIISVAPYAVATNAGLYFAGESNADLAASSLLSQNKTLLIYGSIADSVSTESKSKSDVINTGSVYIDNVQILQMYSQKFQSTQAVFTSGKTFESAMVSTDYPIAIVGRTEPSADLLGWIQTSGVKSGLVITGDSDISGVIESIKAETGLPIFAKLGQGFSGDSQMHSLVVIPLPSKNVLLTVNSVTYSNTKKAFEVEVLNSGEVDAYVRVSASLPSAVAGSSSQMSIMPGASKIISVPLSSVPQSQDYISLASFQIYSGSDEYVVESIDAINFTNIRKTGTAPSGGYDTTYVTRTTPTQVYPQMQGGMIFSVIVALVLMFVGAYLFVHTSKSSHRPNSKGRKKHATHKTGGRGN